MAFPQLLGVFALVTGHTQIHLIIYESVERCNGMFWAAVRERARTLEVLALVLLIGCTLINSNGKDISGEIIQLIFRGILVAVLYS